MSEKAEDLIVSEAVDCLKVAEDIDLFVLAAGFEDRALHTVSTAKFSGDAHCLVIKYVNDIDENESIFQTYLTIINAQFCNKNIHVVELKSDEIEQFARALEKSFQNLPPEIKRIEIDVSGMTSYAICLSLKYARKIRPFEKQRIIYTSALAYVPSFEEYKRLTDALGEEEIDYLPKSMALEMSENLVIEAFAGHRSGRGRACLAIFAGYEVHRSSGTIDAINPSLLLLLYGIPGEEVLSWRLDLSKKLHAKFESGRRCAMEETSTLHVQESIDILENYYNYLLDDYDLVIAPVCSKMHSLAAYLFWERYGEVQLSFPLPIGYNPNNRPTGVGKTYTLELYEQRMLFRNSGSTNQ